MRFTLENAGPIKRAEIDLSKSLIVLTGPNGTGKTWLAWAVYAMGKFRSVDLQIREISRQLADGVFVGDLEAAVARSRSKLLKATSDRVDLVLSRSFGGTPAQFSDARLSLGQTGAEAKPHRLNLDELPSGLGVLRRSDGVWAVGNIGLGPEERAEVARQLDQWMQGLVDVLPKPIIFPVERMSAPLFARELSYYRAFGDGSNSPYRERVDTVFPEPITDCLKMAASLHRHVGKLGSEADLADLLEELMGGRVHTSEVGDLSFAHTSGIVLPLQISASMVKSLSLIAFYFRHMAQKGDFLIIDEPELNLHPDNQRKIARFIVRAIHRGFRIMLSTHSDWFLRELSCMLMAGQLPAEELESLGIRPDEVLRPEEIGTWLFRPDGHTEEVKVGDFGISIQTIDDETHKMSDLEQKLSLRLLEKNDE